MASGIHDKGHLDISLQNNNEAEKKKLALSWSTKDYPLKPEDICCDGCLNAGGNLIKLCLDCDVRACGMEKKVRNCAYCDEYPCARLDKIFKQALEAKKNLDEIKNSSF